MSGPCRLCGSAGSCVHRTVEPPRELEKDQRPKSRGPGRKKKYDSHAFTSEFDMLIARGDHSDADRYARRNPNA